MKPSSTLENRLLSCFVCAVVTLAMGCGATSGTSGANFAPSNSAPPASSPSTGSSSGGGASSGTSAGSGSSSGSGSGASGGTSSSGSGGGSASGGSSSGGSAGSGGSSGGSGGSGSGGGTANPTPGTPTGAFLYVGLDDGFSSYGTAIPNTGHASIAGFAILSDGTLQATPGSPYAGPSASLSSNAAALTLYAASGPTLDVNRINSDGSLTTTATLSSQPLTPSIGFYEHLAFNSPAAMLYASTAHGAGDNFWEIYKTGGDGALTANGSKQDNPYLGALSFVPDGQRAYQPYCYHLDGNIFAYNVGADGQLKFFDSKAPLPSIGGMPGCPFALAVSPDGKYVAAAINPKGDSTTGSALGIFSVNSDGTLSATTGSPFPRTDVGHDIAWDVSGRFIAVAEKDGLWVYSVAAGSAPVPVGGAPVVTGAIDHVTFNKGGTLLFAINSSTQNLYEFNFNSSTGTVTPAPGSPQKMNLVPYQLAVVER